MIVVTKVEITYLYISLFSLLCSCFSNFYAYPIFFSFCTFYPFYFAIFLLVCNSFYCCNYLY